MDIIAAAIENDFHYQQRRFFMPGNKIHHLLYFALTFMLLAACSQAPVEQPAPDASGGKLKVVATTTIVADVVAEVGGEMIELDTLLPVGADPHGFNPTPQDVAKIADAELVFANGAGLEEFLEELIENAGAEDKVVHVSEGIDFLEFEEGEHHHEGEEHEEHEDEEHEEHEGEEHEHHGIDPHTWTDPNNVILWVHNIEAALNEIDPENAKTYQANAEDYEQELVELDAWIREQVDQVPQDDRKLVSDHAIFGYFARAYGFEQVGALIPGYSTMAEPSAQELTALEDAIGAYDVQAIFVGNTVNPSLGERVAEDTGVALVFVYTGSLSEPDGLAGSYIKYTEFITNAFVEALK
jgi:ABC-type Zn uptake system ZnuABC Zn-binding protein ZnuA